MNTFTWLVIGHLVGDWLLQNDWMAKGKREQFITQAGMTHFLIYTLAVMLTFGIANGSSVGIFTYLLVTVLVFVSHWLIDATRVVEFWMHMSGQTNIPMVRVMVDQTFHFLVLALVAWFCP